MFKKQAHEYLVQKGCRTMSQPYTAFQVEEMLNEFAQQMCSTNNWKLVSDETPPQYLELLAQSPSGIIHLTSWRPAYDIFCCQAKTDKTEGWMWKLI